MEPYDIWRCELCHCYIAANYIRMLHAYNILICFVIIFEMCFCLPIYMYGHFFYLTHACSIRSFRTHSHHHAAAHYPF